MIATAGVGAEVDFPVGVLMIDTSLRATAQTPTTGQWLQSLQPASVPYGATLPASLFQLAARVRHAHPNPGNRETGTRSRLRLRSAQGEWVLAEAQPLDDDADIVVVTLRQAAPP